MIRHTVYQGILVAAAGLALPLSAWGGCAFGNPPVTNGTAGGSYATIQAAIAAASPGDTIIVPPGTYNEQLLVNKAGLTLRSSKGPAPTCIQRPGDGAVITVSAANVVIGGHDAGFTLQDKPGVAHGNGSGIYFDSASPNGTAKDNVIQNMTESTAAAGNGELVGIKSLGSNTLIEDNLIQNLQAGAGAVYGDLALGIQVLDDNPRIVHNVIRFLTGTVFGVTDYYGVGTPPPPVHGTIEIAENVISNLIGKPYLALGIELSSPFTDILIRDNSILHVNVDCHCQQNGIRIDSSVAFVRILGNTINDTFEAVKIGTTGGSRINYNNFIDNPYHAVNSFYAVDATNNYWGCPTGPGTDHCDGFVGPIKYLPFATSPFDLAVAPLNP
jgi:hypothetical protein